MFGKITTCVIYVWVNNQNVKMLSECNPCTVNLFLFMHLSLEANRQFVSLLGYNVLQTEQILYEKRFCFVFCLFFSWNQTLLRICNSATSSCGVHSDRKLEWPKEESPAQSNVKRPKCDFERLTDCCNKVNNKSCSDWMSGCLGANGTTPSAWPWDWPVQITHLLTLCF